MTKRKKTKEEIREDRSAKKECTEEDTYRNRLFRFFGNNIRKKDGGLPSPITKLVEMTLRTWTRLRYGDKVSQECRNRTITVGLDKVLVDTFAIPSPDLDKMSMTERFQDLSDYVAKVKVLASLFANFNNLEAFQAGEPLPEANAKYYSTCLMACSSRKGGERKIHESFTRFCEQTGNTPLPKKTGVSTLFERQV